MLKKMKHAYLQQMFAENGESMPRLRFADFDGEWEQRKLGELVDTVKSYSLSRDVETSEHTGFRYVHYGDIHKKIADLIKDDSILPIIKAGEYELLQKDDVIVADASEDYIGIAEPSIILENPKDKIVAGLHTIAMRPKEIDSLFLYYLLHTNRFKRFGNKVGTGMKVFGITTNNLYKFIVLMPNIKEQVKIGTFFKQLDDNITLNQTKLDKLKLIKNVYLQKMFI
ncbi:restriction endonuclease subunit S [Sedimentibacter sp.]|uniref:restriction endonuclease subunit S n=1 Tax=Sedimentibacter sp. TaxID=1960295 RepID=UPI00289F6230|nr:restriction endonuclease subunit S [Sedimentibacter sp.]